jgi:valienol-1-phosphate guanylyltransferase
LIEESTVFAGARVGRDAVVRDCVLLPGAHVPAGTRLESAIVLEDGTVQQLSPAPSDEAAIP